MLVYGFIMEQRQPRAPVAAECVWITIPARPPTAFRLASGPLLPHGGYAGSGGSRPSVVLDAKEVLFSQQLI